jgi:YfiH family protein
VSASAAAPDADGPLTDASVAPPARSGPARRDTAPERKAPQWRPLGEERVADPVVPRSELGEWPERFGLVAGLTMRGGNGGFSLGLLTEEPVAQVMGRWRAFQHAMKPGFAAVQLAQQVHSARVAWHEQVGPGMHLAEPCDGHATAQRGLLLAVTVADCIPVYLAAGPGKAFALLHAGWRGIAEGVLERGVSLLAQRAAVTPGQIAVHLGVGICGDCYEVGPEVVKALEGRRVRRAMQLDLRDVLAGRLARLGVHEVTRSPLCTSCNRGEFFSHRGSGGRDGRMVAYLGRPLDGATLTV